MKKLFLIAIPIVIFLTVVVVFVFNNKKTLLNPTQLEMEKVYSMDEVVLHTDQSSCWLVIDSKVYDVTKFIPMHEGGDKILMGCGKDATDLFTNQSEHDGGEAQKMLSELQIGILAGS